jgi:outer membrane immunogenic protein
MKRLPLGTVVFFAVAAANASAADLPVYKAPVAPPVVYSWTGCYLGGNGGGGWSHKRWTDPAAGDVVVSEHDLGGGVAGGQVGCDYQTGNWVFGVAADADWANLSGNGPDLTGAAFGYNSKVDFIGTVTGRAGFAVVDRSMFYVKGGAAWVHDNFFITVPPAGATAASVDQTRWGFVVGGGWEWAVIKNLSVFAEYDYMDFGKQGSTFTGPLVAPFSLNIDQKVHVLKVGLNLRFGSDGPWVTR